MNSMQTSVATKKRLAAYSGGKSAYASVSGNLFGSFQPVSNTDTVQALGIIGQAFVFITDGTADVRKNDILTVGSTDYTVKGVRLQNNGSINELECYLVLTTTD